MYTCENTHSFMYQIRTQEGDYIAKNVTATELPAIGESIYKTVSRHEAGDRCEHYIVLGIDHCLISDDYGCRSCVYGVVVIQAGDRSL